LLSVEGRLVSLYLAISRTSTDSNDPWKDRNATRRTEEEKKDVERIVAECILCQAYTRRARVPAPGASFPPVARFRAIHVDYVPMPSATANGVTYTGFLLVIDRATGMARFLPVTSKRGAELAAALERDWILQIGPPATLTADNALETRGKVWRALCAKYKIDADDVVQQAGQRPRRAARAER
jgi:hypothetical protein